MNLQTPPKLSTMTAMTTNYVSVLKNQGHKITKVRTGVIKILSQAPSPLGALEILSQYSLWDKQVNKTTIYRELIFLKNQNVIKEIDLGEGKKRYELDQQDHHHHLVCTNCKKIEHIDLGSIEEELIKTKSKVEKNQGFKVTEHNLELFGLCQNCQK